MLGKLSVLDQAPSGSAASEFFGVDRENKTRIKKSIAVERMFFKGIIILV